MRGMNGHDTHLDRRPPHTAMTNRPIPCSAALLVVALPASLFAAGPEVITNSVGMRLIPIPPGTCLMGQAGPPADYKMFNHPEKFDEADWDERPVHRVQITAAFHMAATEVTNEQYERFDPSRREGRSRARFSRGDDDAAINVTWHDAVKFCEWLSAKEGRHYRLPTEAEWEYACRAGTTSLFHTGDSLPDGFHKWVANTGLRDRYFNSEERLKAGKTGLPPEFHDPPAKAPLVVGKTPPNAWGLFDMHGNVEEWCLDWYGPYEGEDQRDPIGRADGDFRVTRGGSHSAFTRLLRSANRSGRLPGTRADTIGMRVVLAPPPQGQPLPAPPAPLNAQGVGPRAALSAPAEQTTPHFSGPRPFVKIPTNSFGPMFSSHNHSPAIAECPNGDLLAVWYSCVDEAGTELCVLASRLARGASEWQPASPFWDGPDVNDHAPKLWSDGKGTLFFFACGLTENITRKSHDSGATWSKATALQPHGELANAPILTREHFIAIPHDNRSTSLVLSRDGGDTWTFPAIASKEHDYRPGGCGWRLAGIHNGLVQLRDGRLMAMGRFDRPEDQARFDFRTPVSHSDDWGHTWTYQASEFPAISSVQRQVLMRLREGPLLFCSFTDQWRDRDKRKGMAFGDARGGRFIGYGLFAALSFDDGQTWPARRLLTPGAPDRTANAIDRATFTLGPASAEPCGYLASCQTHDGMVHLITSKNHYAFNLPWLRQKPPPPKNASH